jgi:hypothetical protein
MSDTDLLFRAIHRGSYGHQIKAIDALRAEVLRDLSRQAPAHGPWRHGNSFGFWRHDPGSADPVYGRRQVISCERCGGAGAEISVSGQLSEGRGARFWDLAEPCNPRKRGKRP